MANSVSTSSDLPNTPVRETASAILLVLAACTAGGTTGVLAEPLRIVGTWLLLLVACLLARDEPHPRDVRWGVWRWAVVAVMLLLPLVARPDFLHELLLVATVAACLADRGRRAVRPMQHTVSWAVLLWSVFLLARRSLPLVWLAADRVGQWFGDFASLLAGCRLQIGASFGAVELLVLLALLYGRWMHVTRRANRSLVIMAILAIVALHCFYLYVLARSSDLAALLPEAAEPEYEHPYTPPPWRWSAALGTLLPWNLPLLAAASQIVVMGLLWHWSRWPDAWPATGAHRGGSRKQNRLLQMRDSPWLLVGLLVAAAAASSLCYGRPDLSGKTIVANARGRLDWQRPQYGRYGRQAAGMFGMLPDLVQSLGGDFHVTASWNEAALSNADAVVLLHPTSELTAEESRRILDYVRRGGSLLVVAEPQIRVGDEVSAHNRLLRETSIAVRRDVIAPATQDWQHALLLASHPITAGMGRRHSDCFTNGGSSLEVHWPARPLIVGRWGWSDPGSDALWTGVHRFEQGERLGDLVLAAEQRYGRGRVLVLGDGYSLTNEGLVRGHVLIGRMLHYLVQGTGNPQSRGRQLLTFVLLVALSTLVARSPDPRRLIWTPMLLALALAVCQQTSRIATRVVPDGRLRIGEGSRVPSRLAYIDASHGESYSDSPWAFDGIDGLALTLMRKDLLTLTLPQLTRERLDRAGVFVSVGPSRSFSASEQQMLVDFVERGGLLLCTVGAEEAAASQPLLARFGIRVPRSPVATGIEQREPEPMGRLRAVYLRIQQPDGSTDDVGVNFFAGWPIELLSGDGEVLVYGKNDQPLVVRRNFGRGSVIVMGDTGFAMNKNLEYVGGEPFDGRYENADFWRWLLSSLTDDQPWLPPPVIESAQEEQP